MKLIHTADIRLDRCYADQNLPASIGRENRLHLRARFQSILEHAITCSADAVLITGNLLELERLDRDTVVFLREAFEGIAPIPILITPGSCDPCVPTSPYNTELWPENVHIFSRPTWESIRVGAFVVCGFGYDAPALNTNPFDSFSAPETEPFIVMAPSLNADPDEDITANLAHLIEPGLAYVALGGTAQTTAVDEAGFSGAWCAGTPEGTGFSDEGPHHYLEITIAPEFPEAKDAVTVSPVTVSKGRFYQMSLDCTDLASGQEIIEAIRPQLVAEPDRQCVRIVLEGALLPEIYAELTSIREALSEGIVHLDLIDRCFVAENYAALAGQKTSLGAFVARINQEIEDAPDELRRSDLCRSRDLALCAYRGQHLPIRAAWGA